MSHHSDVLIVGGGVIGLTTAYFLAREGHSVELFDKGNLGAEASWAGAGIIPPGNPESAAAPYDRLRAVSSCMFPDFSAELHELTALDNGYRRCGGIEFLDDFDRDSLPAWQSEGVELERLSPENLLALEPGVIAPTQRAYFFPGMAQVRNPWHLRMLIAACDRRGVRLSPQTSVERLEPGGSAIQGIRLASGERRTAGNYLVAAGAWSESLLKPLGVATGIHPVRGQIVLLQAVGGLLQRIVLAGKNYLVPREDSLILIGATEEPEAGFEKRTTAQAVADLIALGRSLLPELARAEVVKCWAGLRPGSLDHLPSLGPVAGYKNLFLAGGHFRAGIQLSPATGQVMKELLTGKKPCIPIDDFLPGRAPGRPFHSAFRS